MNRLFSMLVIGVFTFGALAQSQVDEPAKPVKEKASAEATQSVEREILQEQDSDEDTFTPTEKINVDSSVSFPVDI